MLVIMLVPFVQGYTISLAGLGPGSADMGMELRAAPVGNAGDGIDPGCDGGQEILEDVLAAAVFIEVLWST